MILDPLYFVFFIPGLLFSMWASFKTKSAFNKYSKVRSLTGLTGAQAAQRLLDFAGIRDVEVVRSSGFLSDHYNPLTKKLALSDPVYDQPSIAAIGVACHEAGHAIQHQVGYFPLKLRSALVPTAGIGSKLGYVVLFIGLMMSGSQVGIQIALAGVGLITLVLIFQLVTLPVEFDATARAKKLALSQGLIVEQERGGMSAVLNAAALTYVAAAAATALTIVYYLLRLGVLGGRSD